MSLKGKIVFITGASAGIGAATALAFAAEGARLLLAARRAGRLADSCLARHGAGRSLRALHRPRCARPSRRAERHRRPAPRVVRDRHPGQQRRPQPRSRQTLHGQNRRLGRDDRHQRQRPALRHPLRRSGNGRPWSRPRHQSRLNRRRTRLPQRSRLLRNQSSGAPD